VYTHIANQEREQNTLRHWIRDTLHAKQLRAAFDASMAASVADGERLDASRVGDRRNRADKKKRPIDESTSPEIIDAFDRAVREGTDRFKRRKAASASAAAPPPPPPSRASAPREPSQASNTARSRPQNASSRVPNDELSD
jgi:type IV secretory pathway VirB10-like protein